MSGLEAILLLTVPVFAHAGPRLPEAPAPPIQPGACVEVLAGYGPQGGSPHHAGRRATGRNNDHFALDLAPTSEDPVDVHASLGGVVVRAGWGKGPWAGLGRFVTVRHLDEHGLAYLTTYAHLGDIDADVVPGHRVARGARLGELGRSCFGEDACEEVDRPHLHWSVHLDPRLGPLDGGGPVGGQAVVPEPLMGQSGIQRGQVLCAPDEDRSSPGGHP